MRFVKYAAAAALAASSLTAGGSASAAIVAESDPILFWNDMTLATLTAPPPMLGSPLFQTRGYAMVNIAMHDAVNAALGGPNRSYLSGVSATGGDPRAAASQAAYEVLVALNPGAQLALQTALNASLGLVPDGAAKTNGIATGQAYAAAILAARSMDGSSAVVPYTTTGLPGDYRSTGMGSAAAPHWGDVTTFMLNSGDQFRAGPPPALGSAEYAAAYNEVKEIGSAGSLTRTADQTDAALFWDAANGAPWLRIGVTIAEDEALSTLEFASAFALLTTSMADALIAGFDSKYEYRLWRPISAIQLGDTDGNAATAGDPAWTSLFPAPLHPSYISTHSALSGAGYTILNAFFGDDEGFTISIAGDSRSFTGIGHAAQDGANSRLWGGIHFGFDNQAGLEMGKQVGSFALRRNTFDAIPEPGTWAMLIAGFALVGSVMRGRARGVRVAAA